MEEFEKALALSPNDTAHYPDAAQAYVDAGQRDKAIAVLKKINDVKEPEDPAEYDDNMKDAKELLKKLGGS